MSTTFNGMRDSSGNAAYAPQPAVDIFSGLLSTNTPVSFTVPNNPGGAMWMVNISSLGSNIFVSWGRGTAVVPTTFGTGNSELNPGARTVPGGTVISIITPDTNAYVQASVWVY